MEEDETKMETEPEAEPISTAETTEVTNTEVTETTTSLTTEVEDTTEVTVTQEDTSSKVENIAEEVTESKTEEVSESQAEDTIKESEDGKITEEHVETTEKPDVATEEQSEATAVETTATTPATTPAPKTKHASKTAPKLKKKHSSPTASVAKPDYAYDADNYIVDEKNIFAQKRMNVFTTNLNIFGEPRQSVFGPAVTFSSSGGEEGEEYEHLGDRRSFFDDYNLPTDYGAPIDREAYIEEYRNLTVQKTTLRQKNGILNKKLSEYYKKRKNERVFDDVNPHLYEEVQLKYERKIDDFYEFRSKLQREREGIENEIFEMKQQRDEQKIELSEIFRTMLLREKEIATGLIDTKTGKTITDKLISTLIQRQTTKSTQIGEIRLGFIKKRDKVREIDAKLKSLETIGGTLHLMDFEQIRMENQTFTDKIEEREDELMRLRSRFSIAIQELTHARLKSHVLEEQIAHLAENTETVEEKVSEAREYLTNLKLMRDRNRSQTSKLQLNSGLLTHTKLLRDMEITMNELAKVEDVYEEMKIINKDKRQKIIIIRQNLEEVEREQWQQKKTQSLTRSKFILSNKPSDKNPRLPKVTVKAV